MDKHVLINDRTKNLSCKPAEIVTIKDKDGVFLLFPSSRWKKYTTLQKVGQVAEECIGSDLIQAAILSTVITVKSKAVGKGKQLAEILRAPGYVY